MSGTPSREAATCEEPSGPSPPVASSSPATEDALSPPTANSPSHATPVEHRRNRKSWTEEEMRAFWKQKKQEKKERKKATAANRQQLQQAEWDKLTDEEKESRRAAAAELHERRRQAEATLVKQCEERLSDPAVPVLVFDLSFAWCMTVPDTKSTVSQVKFSYSSLRNAGFPFRPVITSLLGRERADAEHEASAQSTVLQVLRGFEGFRRFPPQITHDPHWSDVFPAERVVFLTADAPDVLTDVEPDTVYIIGAFVDHNRHKGLSYAAAQRHHVRAARLPLKESVDIGNRCKVLTINHVVDVLIKYMALRAAGTADWAEAIDAALPIRRVQQEAQGGRKRHRVSANGSSASNREEGESEEESDAAPEDSADGAE